MLDMVREAWEDQSRHRILPTHILITYIDTHTHTRIHTHIQREREREREREERERGSACNSSSGMRCRDWSSHALRTMSSIKTNIYGAALEYGLEDHKGVESCRRQQILTS